MLDSAILAGCVYRKDRGRPAWLPFIRASAARCSCHDGTHFEPASLQTLISSLQYGRASIEEFHVHDYRGRTCVCHIGEE